MSTIRYMYNIKTIAHQLIPIQVASPADAWKIAMEYGDELMDIEFIGMIDETTDLKEQH